MFNNKTKNISMLTGWVLNPKTPEKHPTIPLVLAIAQVVTNCWFVLLNSLYTLYCEL